MIIQILTLMAIMGVFIVVGEALLHRYHHSNEASRKLIHIAHGVGLALLACIAPLSSVVWFELIFLLGMALARHAYPHASKKNWILHYVARMYRVGRLSYGDVFFPVAAIVAAIIAHSKWEFVAGILVLGLADAVAALVGKKYGLSNSYRIFGQKKSMIGTMAFFTVASVILSIYAAFVPTSLADVGVLGVLTISGILAAAENLGVYGSDNFLIPIIAVLALNIAA